MDFCSYYRKHTATEEIPKYVMKSYNDKSLMEKVVIATKIKEETLRGKRV